MAWRCYTKEIWKKNNEVKQKSSISCEYFKHTWAQLHFLCPILGLYRPGIRRAEEGGRKNERPKREIGGAGKFFLFFSLFFPTHRKGNKNFMFTTDRVVGSLYFFPWISSFLGERVYQLVLPDREHLNSWEIWNFGRSGWDDSLKYRFLSKFHFYGCEAGRNDFLSKKWRKMLFVCDLY